MLLYSNCCVRVTKEYICYLFCFTLPLFRYTIFLHEQVDGLHRKKCLHLDVLLILKVLKTFLFKLGRYTIGSTVQKKKKDANVV